MKIIFNSNPMMIMHVSDAFSNIYVIILIVHQQVMFEPCRVEKENQLRSALEVDECNVDGLTTTTKMAKNNHHEGATKTQYTGHNGRKHSR